MALLLFQKPMVKEDLYPEHDLFIQSMKLKNTLRYLMGEEQITHFGLDYYMSEEEEQGRIQGLRGHIRTRSREQ